MVERVAAAHYARWRELTNPFCMTWGELSPSDKAPFIEAARAAIAAMAYEDGADEDMFVRVSTAEYVEPVSLICAWDALIEEALK